jgi:predicted nuclease of predicted toxin-antitoxin system
MRFLADMGVASRVVEWLREQGYDARHLREEQLQRLPDDQIFRKAVAENRVVLTLDLDFGEIVAFSGQQNVSVVLFRLQNTRAPHVIDRLRVVLQEALSALEQGAVVVVEESRFRIRRLPIGR